MKVNFVEVNIHMCESLSYYFREEIESGEVAVHNIDIETFLDENEDIDTIVTAGNSFGIMDGGLDFFVRRYYMNNGVDIETLVREGIQRGYNGEQPVGTAMVVHTYKQLPILIYSPTMRYPMKLNDFTHIRDCMRLSMFEAHDAFSRNIIMPSFGAGTGLVNYAVCAMYLKQGYDNFYDCKMPKNWEEVSEKILREVKN